jgi:hypothetical protein
MSGECAALYCSPAQCFHYIPFITGQLFEAFLCPALRVSHHHFSGCPNSLLPVASLCCTDIACSQIIPGTLPAIGAILIVTTERV